MKRDKKGCNYFKCINIWCNYEFCWICGNKYEPSHYRNPLSTCFRLQESEFQGRLIESNRIRRLRCILIILLLILILLPIICIFFSFFGIILFVLYFYFDIVGWVLLIRFIDNNKLFSLLWFKFKLFRLLLFVNDSLNNLNQRQENIAKRRKALEEKNNNRCSWLWNINYEKYYIWHLEYIQI